MKPTPEWICKQCAERHCRGMPEGHIATWHVDECGVCGWRVAVTEPRDFGGMKNEPERIFR